MHKIWILKFYSHLQNKSHLLAKMCDILELEYFVKEVGAMFDGVARASVPMLARASACKRLGAACISTILFHQWLCTALSMVLSASIMVFGSDFLGKNVVAALPRSKGGFASHESGHCRPRRSRPEYGLAIPARRIKKRLCLHRRPDLLCPRHRHECVLRYLAARSGIRLRAASP